MSETLVGITGRDWHWDWVRRGGWSAGASELAVHIADVRRHEQADLVQLDVRSGERAATRAPEYRAAAPGEVDGLRSHAPVELSTGVVIVCRLAPAPPDDKPSRRDGKPGVPLRPIRDGSGACFART
ncbi:hypothetical protein [Streptomyces niger]|uniref:hypothetical protein n=1 Tax=Streptomyces niger TaxID=66373 RepID=UPI0018FE8F1C|nr:hypothetical protein [Streptomyces niger]